MLVSVRFSVILFNSIIIISKIYTESQPCSPNPCSHGGLCLQRGDEFSCDCRGTNHTGDTCRKGIVKILTIPTLTQGDEQMVTLSTDIDVTKPIRVSVKTGGRPTIILLTRQSPTVSFPLTPTQAGPLTITFTTDKTKYIAQPSQSTVLVRGKSEPVTPTNHYFTTLMQKIGILRKGCCGLEGFQPLSCSENAQAVGLKAVYQWTRVKEETYSAPGVIFAESGSFSLPLSIAGYQVEKKDNLKFRSQLPKSIAFTRCDAAEELCDQNPPFNSLCYCYTFSQSDTSEFLNGLTYIQQIGSLLPTWLKVWVDLENARLESKISHFDFFALLADNRKKVKNQKGCENLEPVPNGIYSVLRFDKTISAEIDGNTYSYIESSDGVSDSDPMCFVVNMCKGHDSPLYIQPSLPIQRILAAEYLRSFTVKAWVFQLDSISVSRVPQVETITHEFWNSSDFFSPVKVMYDVSISSSTTALFQSESLNITLFFSGKALMELKVC